MVSMLVTVGPSADLHSTPHIEWVAVKLLFALSVIGTGALLLNKSMRPGLEDETNWAMIFFPFLAALAVSFAVLLGQPQAWSEMLRGATTVSSLRCLLSIMFFAMIPLAVVIYVLREGAPTRLKLCGGDRRDCRGRTWCGRLRLQLYERYRPLHCDLVRRSHSSLRSHWSATRSPVLRW